MEGPEMDISKSKEERQTFTCVCDLLLRKITVNLWPDIEENQVSKWLTFYILHLHLHCCINTELWIELQLYFGYNKQKSS